MFTEKDFEKAKEENKTYANLQFIESEPKAVSTVRGDFDKLLNYLCNVISVLMTEVEIDDYKPLIQKISQRIEDLYVIHKTSTLVQKHQGQNA